MIALDRSTPVKEIVEDALLALLGVPRQAIEVGSCGG